MTMSDPDEVNDRGCVCFDSCSPIEPHGIQIVVAEMYRDDDYPLDRVLLTCHGGSAGFEYLMDVDQAEALAHLLMHAARQVRRMAEVRQENEAADAGDGSLDSNAG
jgi:hypothetical protein